MIAMSVAETPSSGMGVLRSEVAIMKFPIRFYCALGVSATLLAFLPRFVSF